MRFIERLCITFYFFCTCFVLIKFPKLIIEDLGLQILNTIEWAPWAQAVGSVAAIGVSIWVSNRNYHNQRRIEQERIDSEVKHTLDALYDEVNFFLQQFNTGLGQRLNLLGIRGTPFLDEFTPYDAWDFPIFDGYKNSIGKIQDRELRSRIIKSYAQMRALLLSFSTHNRLLAEFSAAAELYKKSGVQADKEKVDFLREELIGLSTRLRDTWRSTRDACLMLIHDIHSQRQDT